MAGLNAYSICQFYTLEQIQEKISFYQSQMDGSTTKEYRKDSTQGTQSVESADMDKIGEVLQVWLRAYQLKSGSGGVRIVSANFGGHL